MAANTAGKASHRRLVERFDRDVSAKNLDALAKRLNDTANRIGFIAYSVETSADALGGFGLGASDYQAKFASWTIEKRKDLPSVSHETVGRLTVFLDDVRGSAEELLKSVERIENSLAQLWYASNLLDGMKGGDDA